LSKRGQYGSSSDLYIDEKAEIAIIGIQTSESGSGHDTIYVLKNNGNLDNVLDKTFKSGRMWPTGILEDGSGFKYTIKFGDGEIHNRVYDFQKDTFYIEEVINPQPRPFYGI
ncbi:MAG: hypothetical protein KJ646_01735, partial [Nanoarchaeota archaeon]|nr:hypothetical protein [Nanoarchaeota archaeon]MBU4116713.1 hypothetical protein [Nanoarchaeota archaeon]